jgi:hypothetical protein
VPGVEVSIEGTAISVITDAEGRYRLAGVPPGPSAENHTTIYTIAESPRDARVIWVGTDDGNIQVTRDGGATWSNVVAHVPELPPGTWVSHVEASPHAAGRAYATFDGHRTGDMATHVYRTDDYGATWRSIVRDGLDGYAHVIREDPENPDLLFVGTESGLYVSVTGGEAWVPFRSGLPGVAVMDLAIHPREHDLIIATHGRGIYILDDLTPLRHLTPAVLEQPICPAPAYRSASTIPALIDQRSRVPLGRAPTKPFRSRLGFVTSYRSSTMSAVR